MSSVSVELLSFVLDPNQLSGSSSQARLALCVMLLPSTNAESEVAVVVLGLM
jgi:hypothetical protein